MRIHGFAKLLPQPLDDWHNRNPPEPQATIALAARFPGPGLALCELA
jgi:hypothetical protein